MLLERRPRGALLELVGHLGETGFGAVLVTLRARAADANRTDGVVADLHRYAAAQRDDIEQLALAGQFGGRAGPLRPFPGGTVEGARRVGLATGELDIVRRCPIALQENAQPPGAI